MMIMMKTENSAFHGELVTGKTFHARALMDNVCRQLTIMKFVKETEKIARLMPAKQEKL